MLFRSLPETGRVAIGGIDYAIVTQVTEPSYEVCAQALLQRIGAAAEAPPATVYSLLLSTGDFFLLETGDNLNLA